MSDRTPGISRRDLLAGSAAAGILAPGLLASAASGGDKLLVVVLAEGGWDVTFAFDPKGHLDGIDGPQASPGGGAEELQRHGDIRIAANPVRRPAVSAWFERWHSRAAVVNGIWMGSISHGPCRKRILTGTTAAGRAGAATIAGATWGDDRPLGSVDLSGWSITGPLASTTGRVGARNQLKALVDPDAPLRAPPDAGFQYPLWRPEADDHDRVEAWLRGRTERLRLRRGLDGGEQDRLFDDLQRSRDRADRLRDHAGPILAGLQLGGQAAFAPQVDVAVELLAGGLCAAVTLDSRRSWDTHDDNTAQHALFDELFAGLDQLATALHDLDLLDRTVVAVVSEMTRTPRLNASGGKDHWGHTSALLFGAVRGGVQLGGTDDRLESLPVDLRTGAPYAKGKLHKYDNFAAGLLELVGVDAAAWLPGVEPWRGAHL